MYILNYNYFLSFFNVFFCLLLYISFLSGISYQFSLMIYPLQFQFFWVYCTRWIWRDYILVILLYKLYTSCNSISSYCFLFFYHYIMQFTKKLQDNAEVVHNMLEKLHTTKERTEYLEAFQAFQWLDSKQMYVILAYIVSIYY